MKQQIERTQGGHTLQLLSIHSRFQARWARRPRHPFSGQRHNELDRDSRSTRQQSDDCSNYAPTVAKPSPHKRWWRARMADSESIIASHSLPLMWVRRALGISAAQQARWLRRGSPKSPPIECGRSGHRHRLGLMAITVSFILNQSCTVSASFIATSSVNAAANAALRRAGTELQRGTQAAHRSHIRLPTAHEGRRAGVTGVRRGCANSRDRYSGHHTVAPVADVRRLSPVTSPGRGTFEHTSRRP